MTTKNTTAFSWANLIETHKDNTNIIVTQVTGNLYQKIYL